MRWWAISISAMLLGAAAPASATIYAYSYHSTTGILSGQLSGTLQSDQNDILIDGLGATSFNGAVGPALPILTTASSFYGVDRAPHVTLDGSIADFFGCTDASCEFGVLFDPDIVDFTPLVSTSAEFGNIREPFVRSNFTIAAVPEPATWLSLMIGFCLMGFALRISPRRFA